MTYSRRIDRLSPALIIVLVDQSDSMAELIAGAQASKAQAVANHINTLLYELILRCAKTPREPPRAYFYVSVLGYSTTPDGRSIIEPALTVANADGVISTTDLATSTLRVESRHGPTGSTINSPVWIEPVGRGGTPMCAALNRAGQLAASWVAQHPDAFPPVVVNLSDGEATDGDPAVWAGRLRSLSTSDGHVLLFNLNLSTDPGTAHLFPSDMNGLSSQHAAKLFDMSSPLPDSMIDIARSQGIAIRPGARGFAFNADIKALTLFLNVGTSIGRIAR
ncbi:vWA domain-containing protein [Pseudonocardia sp. GCM10023141]|uniref:vWA domain-containing protein n=1 Tax=Pseudonocardia sp. GCM10023141 TaxID=3252653 RepID=UPI0036098B3A